MRYTRMDSVRDDGRERVLTAFLLGLVMILTFAAVAPGQATAPPPSPNTTYAVGKGVKITGMIVSRDGDQFTVRDDNTHLITLVTIVKATRVFSPSGPLHLEKKNQSAATLIAGLPVTVYGSGGPDGNLIADRIAFRQSGLKVASQINAGEVDLKTRQQEIADHAAQNTKDLDRATARARDVKDSLDETLNALNKRIGELDSYDTKASATVNFAVNSAALDKEAKDALLDLVAKGRNMGLNAFTVEITGFTDATGSNALNERLSQRRADAVAAYLAEVSSVPIRRISSPVGLSMSRPVATNATAAGRAENRRVEVKVLVNRGVSQP
jgi:outer membrane protein OmpA-like peptidoglycan-associated protein